VEFRAVIVLDPGAFAALDTNTRVDPLWSKTIA
jgi:hypothetical protein